MTRRAVKAAAPSLDVLSDFEQYALQLLRIKTKEQDLIPLKFNRAQRLLWALVQKQQRAHRPVRVVILKGRQLGSSTWCEGFVFHQTATHEHTNSMVVAHDRESTETVFKIAQVMYEELPPDFRPMKRRANKFELVFENPDDRARLVHPGLRSQIVIRTAGNEEAGRGATTHHLHLSEVASWPAPEALATSLFPMVPNREGTTVFLESTAKGVGNWWHDFYYRAKNGKSEYDAVFLGWYLDPTYTLIGTEMVRWVPDMNDLEEDEVELRRKLKLTRGQLAFRRMIIDTHGLDYFRQEYPSDDEEAWLGIGLPVFKRAIIREMYERALSVIPTFRGDLAPSGEMQADPEGDFVIWEQPQPKAEYVLGVDPAQGVEGGTLAAIVILKRGKKQKQVARWKGSVNALQLVPYIESLAYLYNEGLVSIEVNSSGLSTQEALARSYSHNYRWRVLDKRSRNITEKIGWYSSVNTKQLLITHMQQLFEEGSFETYDPDFLRQTYGLSNVGESQWGSAIVEPEPGVGDDIFMAGSIASLTDFLDAGYERDKLLRFAAATGAAVTPHPVNPDEPQEVSIDRQWYKDIWNPFEGAGRGITKF